ncbi:hypothetical protein EV368DRAFT_87695 [Lentinula lateritia]|nr:hypothetical protein EV368DRAFT_87695 [Lentinula lateritia]
MPILTWHEPVVGQPLDAYQLSPNELLPHASPQTAVTIAACSTLPAAKSNYEPIASSVAAFLENGFENSAACPPNSLGHWALLGPRVVYFPRTLLASLITPPPKAFLSVTPGDTCYWNQLLTPVLANGRAQENAAGATSDATLPNMQDPCAVSMPTAQCDHSTANLSASNDADSPLHLPLKKKRSGMGQAEKAALACAEKLLLDLEGFLISQNELRAKVAEENNVTVARVATLLNQVSARNSTKKASNYNVLVFLKTQELNASNMSGWSQIKFFLKDTHAAVKKDEDLMEALKDPDLLAEYRDFFDSKKAEQKVTAVWAARGKSHNALFFLLAAEFASQANFLVDAIGAAVFGIVARGSFESSVTSLSFGLR